MKSCKKKYLLDLERDIPTMPEDCAALRECRRRGGMPTDDYFRFLEVFADFFPPHLLRAKRGPMGNEMFTL
jgi:hypothetical protein